MGVWPSLDAAQGRLEESEWGRSLLSVFIAVVLVTVVTLQLPDSNLRSKAMSYARPISHALGIDQNWALFAPDPRRRAIDLEARLTYADGSTRTWRLPKSNPVVGAYSDYRWRKYAETLMQDRYRWRWLPFAAWVAREEAAESPLERLQLVRRWSELEPPGGDGPFQSPWREYAFLDLSGPALAALAGQ